ncbi:hypothetical protein Aple_101440 [Acrocarpospora pleiomorpha]|uniref:Tetratrico peptide repeat group 5 domain-containing protein n=1 Tax=Acrocarpospora pleiomorpha TaxID=90975 RepID=A0A5M3Y1Q3_9ACTN|nr:hypothetical protein [Acrocarpospora pleiomorpha]GES27244.1 hypothetical protein Aple_101440 [Acrocarpospora pleiomorpha]
MRPFSRDGEGSRARYGRDEEAPQPKEREQLPELDADITPDELDKEARDELRSLPGDLADLVASHLVATARALEQEDPERAYEHAKVARRFAGRIGIVREATGIAAYHAGQYAEALGDLRAARRMTGSDAYLPIMADSERGLGRPERALDLVKSKEAERLDRAGRIELAIVESGARRDLGQHDAAVITLQRIPELRDPQPKPWSARLAYAYADALAHAGHEAAATDWFGRAMAFDEEGETDAAERYAELTGAVIEDVEEDFEDDLDDSLDDLPDLGDLLDSPSDTKDTEPDNTKPDNTKTDNTKTDAAKTDTAKTGAAKADTAKADNSPQIDGDESDDSGEDAEIVAETAPKSEISVTEPKAGNAEPAVDPAAETAPEPVVDETAATSTTTEPAGDESPAEPTSTGPDQAAKPEDPAVPLGPAFIEPDFGDVLDDPKPKPEA